jgi:peptide chain release factor subunit 1
VPPSDNVFSSVKTLKTINNGCVIVSRSGFCEILTTDLPITLKKYTCDKKFDLEYLLSLYETFPKLGLAYIVGDEVICYLKQGPKIEQVGKLSIFRYRSHNKGGSSAPRFMRTQQNTIAKFITDATNLLNHCFYDSHFNKPIVQSLILASNENLGNSILSQSDFLLHSVTRVMIIDASHVSIECILSQLEPLKIEDQKYDLELQEYISTKLGFVVYGKDLLQSCLDEHLIKILYVIKGFNLYNTNGNITIHELTHSKLLHDYGDAIGIRYFANTNDITFDDANL